METHVALLRGINLAGKNPVAMKALAALFADAGCGEVRTYIASGNVIYCAPEELATRIPAVIGAAMKKRFGFGVAIVTRTAAELRKVVAANPFVERGADPKGLHVVFLGDRPARARTAALEPDRSPPDELVVRGREIYLRCPNGIGRSRFTMAYFEAKLGTASTFRNWRTVLALADLAGRG